MKASKLFAALTALMLVLAACTQAADTTTTTSGETPETTEATGEETTTSAAGEETTTTAGEEHRQAIGLLAEVQARGTLNCGVNNTVPGFGFTDDTGEHVGFDIDFCRAIAAGVLGDPEAVDLRRPDRRAEIHRPAVGRGRRPGPEHHVHLES